jgi:hypothetical protein
MVELALTRLRNDELEEPTETPLSAIAVPSRHRRHRERIAAEECGRVPIPPARSSWVFADLSDSLFPFPVAQIAQMQASGVSLA